MSELPNQNDSLADDLVFAEEEFNEQDMGHNGSWKIIIADDEKEVHNITKMVLDDYRFDGGGVGLLHAYSGKETERLICDNPDTAILLLDVVMESDTSGLDVVRYIRETLKNSFVRIILRTGQPGKAPEKEIITEYDINDYKEKTELTANKLFTTITSSLRAYRDLRTIERNRKGLEIIINSTGHLFAHQRLQKFTEGILTQLSSLLQVNEDSLFLQSSGFAASDAKDKLEIIAGTGRYEVYVNKYVEDVLDQEVRMHLSQAIQKKESLFIDDAYVGYFQTENGSKNLLYFDGCKYLTHLDKDLIRIFSTNVGIAFDNIYLSKEIIETQKEVIETLGEIVETRSEETANHVRRVSELSYLLAIKLGMDEQEANLLRMASPMHDVGKIGIPDAILNKPGKLTAQEFDSVKRHTRIGYEILCKSNRRIIEAAAIVAYQHHERWDGLGYPQGLRGEDIHIFGRIIGLVDVFDALSNSRLYKSAWESERVFQYIKESRGALFDPTLVDLFLDNYQEFLDVCNKYAD
ncbi:DUF3369 domain-containing protein [Desulfosarcina sp.]|uniref:DUF3369 domain-containing protein n=1 Tax=Desulfosarcina sp. TaxID=2027861 RepID=UPI00356A4475